jgi:hypothetical protein
MTTAEIKSSFKGTNRVPAAGPEFTIYPSRIALVARDSPIVRKQMSSVEAKSAVKRARWKYDSHIAKILDTCNTEGCDTIMFSPWTVKTITHGVLFPRSTNHSSVILGVRSQSNGELVQIWVRSRRFPLEVCQVFVKSSDSDRAKIEFVRQLPSRVSGDAALIVCGESNIVRIPRGSKSAQDRFDVLQKLKKAKVRIVLNPVHTYMRRPEMALKRCALSKGRYVVSLWNRGFVRGSESRRPWQIFHNQKDVTGRIRTVVNPIGQKFPLQIGVYDLT